MKARPYRKYQAGKMNGTEAAYAQDLKLLQKSGEIVSYQFEAIKLRLAKNTTYSPDFVVVTDECVELHEVKGFWAEDARVKIKVAAEMFPFFKFVAVKKKGKGWEYEYF